MNCEAEILPLNINGRGRRYGNRHTKDVIGKTLELCVGFNIPPARVAEKLNLPAPTVNEWLTRYWFYKKVDKPIILTLKSKV